MRNWREAGDDQQVFEKAEAVVPSRNIGNKRKPSSHQEIYLAVAEVYTRPGTATSLTHSAWVSQTESWNSRSCNWEKSKCQSEREMLADYSRPRGTISRLTKKAKQCAPASQQRSSCREICARKLSHHKEEDRL